MSKKVTIGTTTYNLPTEGSSPAWGEDMSAIIQALIDVANNSQGPNDILESSATIANSGTFPAQIPGFYFDPSTVRSFVAEYTISRKIDPGTGQVEHLESGTVYGNHGLDGWTIAVTNVGDSKTELNIDSLGNLTYNPEILTGTGYTGVIRFIAKSVSNS